jgi:hypothetical protein
VNYIALGNTHNKQWWIVLLFVCFSTTASVNSENRTNNPCSKRFLTYVYSKLTPPTSCQGILRFSQIMMAAPMTVAKQRPLSDSLDFFQLTFSSRSVIVIYLIKGNTYNNIVCFLSEANSILAVKCSAA